MSCDANSNSLPSSPSGSMFSPKGISRNEVFDQVTGIYIIWMIVVHAIQWSKLPSSPISFVFENLLFPFMPWFYAKSGYFHNSQPLNFKTTITNATKSLLIPFSFWYLFGYFLFAFPTQESTKPILWQLFVTPILRVIHLGQSPGNNPLWFLLSLFCVKLFAHSFLRIKHNAWISLILLSVGWRLSAFPEPFPLGLQTCFLGFFFYSMGYFARQTEVLKLLGYKLTFLLLIGMICIQIFAPSNVDVRTNQVTSGSYLIFAAASLGGIILLVRLCEAFSSPILQWIGRKSMHYFVLHWLIFSIVHIGYEQLRLPALGTSYFFALCVVSGSICTLVAFLDRGIPAIFGKVK